MDMDKAQFWFDLEPEEFARWESWSHEQRDEAELWLKFIDRVRSIRADKAFLHSSISGLQEPRPIPERPA